MTSSDRLPTLLVSGVAERRSDDPRETELTARLVDGVMAVARGRWNVQLSWGQSDGWTGTKTKLDQASAVVVMGGPDVSPSYYSGDSKYANATTHFPRADEAQLELISGAIERSIPLLGICRGMQLLNVARGGTLIQDISALPGHSAPDLLQDFQFSRHTVSVSGGTKLAATLAAVADGVVGGVRTMVHSAHHQAVKDLGAGLSVSATADDGTVEAIELKDVPAIGVQWHPEDPDADPRGLSQLLERMFQRCCATPVAA